jgi:hypothetical protein
MLSLLAEEETSGSIYAKMGEVDRTILPESLLKLQPKNLGELREIYRKWLAIDQDFVALDVILAALLDRRVRGDPLWLFVVAASGATKTEIMRSLYGLDVAFQLSSLTSKTIVSGKERKDGTVVRGLFKKMDGRVVIIPELSQVLTKTREERDSIFGQLRDLYDGHCIYGYGTIDEPITVDCRIGLMCGVTPAIDMYGSVHAVLGERFLKVRPKFDRDLARERALVNQSQVSTMRMELATAAKHFFEKLEVCEPSVTQKQLDRIGLYAEFVAHVRTTVTSQAFKEYDTTEWSPEPEFATRLSQQLLKLAKCLAVIRGRSEITEEDLATVSRVSMDTCIPNRLKVIKALYGSQESLNISQIAVTAGITYRKAMTSLDCLTTIGVVRELYGEKQHNERSYILEESFRLLVNRIFEEKKTDETVPEIAVQDQYPDETALRADDDLLDKQTGDSGLLAEPPRTVPKREDRPKKTPERHPVLYARRS